LNDGKNKRGQKDGTPSLKSHIPYHGVRYFKHRAVYDKTEYSKGYEVNRQRKKGYHWANEDIQKTDEKTYDQCCIQAWYEDVLRKSRHHKK
jgi:hypothetical protein